MRYNNFHKHTHQSNISTPDSILKLKEFASHAVKLNHTILSTVEHGYGGNILEYYDVAQEYDLKFVFGAEMYFVEDRLQKDKENAHILLLAKNIHGMREINKLISESSQTGYYYKNRIDMPLLLSLNPENIIITTACAKSIINYNENLIQTLFNHFGNSLYLEIQDDNNAMQKEYNKKILNLHNKYKIPLIHGCDTHYIFPEDKENRKIFLEGKNINYKDEDNYILDYPEYDTILKRYNKQGILSAEQANQALQNTLIIDEFDDIVLDKTNVKMPVLKNIKDPNKELKTILNTAWKEEKKNIPKEKHEEYLQRIQYEFDIIEKTSMENYFVLNYYIIKRAKELGGVLSKTGRGSGSAFFINKLLGFTSIDAVDSPIPLYPTRFMSVTRILEAGSLPDIDFNTANPKIFEQASKEILGEDNVHLMLTYGTMKESEAFRNLCRSKKLDVSEYNEVAKNLEYYKNHKKWGKIIEESKKYVGVIDSCSQHPCAYLLLDKPISEEFGLYKTKESLCAIIDSDNSDAWKYLKNDFLSVTVWDIINKTFNLIGKEIISVKELEKALTDKRIWDLYEKGITSTLNQTSTDWSSPQIMQYKPQSVGELSAFVAAIRPSFASMKSMFLNREEFSYGIPEFDEILKCSNNFCLYQENIMATLIFAGFEEDVTYGIMKQIAKKKGNMNEIKEKFINGFVEKTGSTENADKLWTILENSVKYGFNSAHSYSTALDSLYGAYLKVYYPLEYYKVVLDVYANDDKTTYKIIKELPYFNIKLNPIKHGKSNEEYNIVKNENAIYKATSSVKYVNDKVAKQLYDLSKKEHSHFLDLLIDMKNETSINTKQIDILTSLNYFSDYGKNFKLLNYIKLFHSLHEKKTVSAKKANELKLNKDLLIKHSKQKVDAHKSNMNIFDLSDDNDVYIKDANSNIKTYQNFNWYEYLIDAWDDALQLEDKELPIIEQIMIEKECLGYAYTTKDIDDKHYVVLDIDKKYTPLLRLYNIKTGEEIKAKLSKKQFYGEDKKENLKAGDLIKVIKIIDKPKVRLVEKKWVEQEEKETWLEHYSRIININNEIKI